MATSSIFLAKEFGVQVWATDLWIAATDNLRRIHEAGVEHLVYPIHAEAHTLPYADGFFDAIVSMDAYQYFGTSDLYAATMVRLLKPGGAFGIVVPGLTQELDDGVPEHLQPYWETEFWCFHSAEWWRRHLERTGPFRIHHAEMIPDGADHWRRWEAIGREVGWPAHYPDDPNGLKMLEDDAGRTLALVQVVGHRA
jgi:SAM-dependent methyltransferase